MTRQIFCLPSFANEQVHVLNYPTLVSRLSLLPEFVGETGFFYYIVNFVNLSGKRNRRENINEITTTAEYFGRATSSNILLSLVNIRLEHYILL